MTWGKYTMCRLKPYITQLPSSRPKPSFGIGNQNQGLVSVSKPKLFFQKNPQYFLTSFGDISFLFITYHTIGNQISGFKNVVSASYGIGPKVCANLSLGFGIGPKRKQWFWYYTTSTFVCTKIDWIFFANICRSLIFWF